VTDVLKDQMLVHTNNVRSQLVTWAEKKAKSKVISPWMLSVTTTMSAAPSDSKQVSVAGLMPLEIVRSLAGSEALRHVCGHSRCNLICMERRGRRPSPLVRAGDHTRLACRNARRSHPQALQSAQTQSYARTPTGNLSLVGDLAVDLADDWAILRSSIGGAGIEAQGSIDADRDPPI
jgi:hypothetical protein